MRDDVRLREIAGRAEAFAELAEAIGRATGRSISIEKIPSKEAGPYGWLFDLIAAGFYERETLDLERLPITRFVWGAGVASALVTNDYDATPGPTAAPAGAPADFYFWQIPSPNSGVVNGGSPLDIEVNMMDAEATQFSNEQLPRVMPDMADFESTEWAMLFSNGTTYGIVSGTLGGVSTPVNASIWGRIKSSYRN